MAQNRSEYFAILPFWESAYQPFKGACPISQSEALKRIHLQLDFDEHNRVVAAHVKVGKHYKDFEGMFGNLSINAPLTKVSYSENTETHTFFDRFGNQTAVMGAVFQKVYQKDTYRRNIGLTFLNKDGSPTGDLFGNYTYEWIHQPDGAVVELRNDQAGNMSPLRGEFQFMRTRMVFGADGYFSLLQNIDENGSLVNTESGAATFRYFYDAQGRFDRWEVFDKNGAPAAGPSDTSGEQNIHKGYDLEAIVFFDKVGKPAVHWSGAERWHFENDPFGNMTVLTYQKNDGTPMNANQGYAETRFNWSEDGRFLLSKSFFDSSGKKALHTIAGIHQVVYERNAKGLITAKIFKDANGQLTAQKNNGIARTEYTYNAQGMLQKTISYDEKGNEVAS